MNNSTQAEAPSETDAKAVDLLAGPTLLGRLRAASRGAALLVVIVVLFTAIGVARPSFFSGTNVVAILLQASVVGILAMGQTYVLITGGIDLSIGSIVAVSAIVTGMLSQVVPAPVAVLGGVSVGALAGLVNGLLITRTGITPFIITLGTMSIYSGLALIISGGRAVYDIPDTFTGLLAGKTAGLPNPIFVVVAMAVVSTLVMSYTKFGEYLIAVGGNAETARLTGVRVRGVTTGAYVVSGAAAGLAAAILVARLGAADPTIGADLLLVAVAATVMGGTKLSGGEGSMFGALFGAILIATLTAGLTSLNIQAFYQQLAVGTVIIVALLVDKVARGSGRS